MYEKETKTCRNIRSYFREYCQATGIHGLRYFVEKRLLIEKIFWVLVLLVSLGCCSYMINGVWTKYRTTPVVINFSHVDTPIYEIPFPAVTICPESIGWGEKYNYTDIYWRINESKPVTPEELKIFTYMQPICTGIRDQNLGNDTMDEEFFKVIRELEVTDLDLCSWQGTYVECNTLFNKIVTDQGLCYSFNTVQPNDLFNPDVYVDPEFKANNTVSSNYNPEGGYRSKIHEKDFPYRAILSGHENSLTLLLWQNADNRDYLCAETPEGFRILLHDPYTLPRLNKDYFSVASNKQVVVAIRPHLVKTSENVKDFPSDKRQCFLQDEKKLKYFKVYTQENCDFECFTNLTLAQCECVEFYMPRTNDTLICGNAKRICLDNVEKEYKTFKIAAYLAGGAESYCDCKPSCSALKYNTESSQNSFNILKTIYAYRQRELLDVPESKIPGLLITKVSIYFKEEQFTCLERQELYGFTDLISNFGGILGLFMGFSILSIVEIFYFSTLRIFCNTRLYGLWSGQDNND